MHLIATCMTLIMMAWWRLAVVTYTGCSAHLSKWSPENFNHLANRTNALSTQINILFAVKHSIVLHICWVLMLCPNPKNHGIHGILCAGVRNRLLSCGINYYPAVLILWKLLMKHWLVFYSCRLEWMLKKTYFRGRWCSNPHGTELLQLIWVRYCPAPPPPSPLFPPPFLWTMT